MTDFNSVVLLGNLTREPELRYTPQGVPLCSFVVAVRGRCDGDPEKTTAFVDVQAWKRLAEVCTQFLGKGRQVLVVGELRQNRWVDDTSKERRSKLLVVAREVKFLGTKEHQGESPTEELVTES